MIQKNWEEYEFDFVEVPMHLKFKMLLQLQSCHPFGITEDDLYTIFMENYLQLNNGSKDEFLVSICSHLFNRTVRK